MGENSYMVVCDKDNIKLQLKLNLIKIEFYVKIILW